MDMHIHMHMHMVTMDMDYTLDMDMDEMESQTPVSSHADLARGGLFATLSRDNGPLVDNASSRRRRRHALCARICSNNSIRS